MTKGLRTLALAAVAVLPLAACQNSDSSNTTPLQAIVVQPTLFTRTFSGTVNVGGQSNTNFTTTDAGTLAVTLTSAGPPPTITMALGLGQPSTTDATQCVNAFGIQQNGAASTTPLISVTAPAGNYCVAVLDIGQATGPVNYTFTVTAAFGSQ